MNTYRPPVLHDDPRSGREPPGLARARTLLRLSIALLVFGGTLVSDGQAGPDTYDQLMRQGREAFGEEGDLPAAEQAFRRAMDHPDATPAQKEDAHFYWGAALGRQERLTEAVDAQADFLRRYPKSRRRHYVLLFHGVYHRRLGDPEKARACWETIVREAPEGPLAKHARGHLHGPPRSEPADPGYQPGRALPADAGRPGPYLVVTVEAPADFQAVAREVAAFHEARVSKFSDFETLEALLSRVRPKNVLFVVPPDVLDVNLHRRILLMSAKLDDDIFPDFAFGYLTARDAEALGNLWERTRRIHEHGLSSKRWIRTAVSTLCRAQSGGIADIASAAGFEGAMYYWGYQTPRAEMDAFVDEHLPDLATAGVIAMTGCGDPQGTWLFSDERNRQRDKHWTFDADKVGHDPEGEMPRITADRIRALNLASPVVWTGVCHAGATGRVFVEGDIVSTFGDTKGIATLYELDPDDSFCLAVLDAGAAAYICPIGANHGGSVSREVDFTLEHGASLGEAVKSTYDEVFRSARGRLQLGLQEAGKPETPDGYVMQGGGSNRILLGDPALRPFAKTAHPRESIELRDQSETGFTVAVTWEKGYHPRAWDIYRNDKERDWGVQTRVDLEGIAPEGKQLTVTAAVLAADEKGEALPYTMVDAEPETYHGRRYLHLHASAPREQAAYYTYLRAEFRVTIDE